MKSLVRNCSLVPGESSPFIPLQVHSSCIASFSPSLASFFSSYPNTNTFDPSYNKCTSKIKLGYSLKECHCSGNNIRLATDLDSSGLLPPSLNIEFYLTTKISPLFLKVTRKILLSILKGIIKILRHFYIKRLQGSLTS